MVSNCRSYLLEQIDHIIAFKNKGDTENESYYLKQYENNLKTFNRLFGENDKSFFKVVEEKTKMNNPKGKS